MFREEYREGNWKGNEKGEVSTLGFYWRLDK